MRSFFDPFFGAVIAVAFAGAAFAQTAVTPKPAPSAPVPAASQPTPIRSPAVKAAESAKEPGKLVPEQRVIPQISVPLKSSSSTLPAAPAASLPAGTVPGTVNDGAARCMAVSGEKEKAACERGLEASAPLKKGR